MRLLLVHHGQAKTEEEDPDRPLTDQGVDDVGRVARHAIDRLGVRAVRAVHSGKTRARQTAELWSAALGIDPESTDGLAPNDDPTIWRDRLDGEPDDLLLVGHLPHLGRLSALLLTGDADQSVIRFRPGGLVGLDHTDSGWIVSMVLPPDGAPPR